LTARRPIKPTSPRCYSAWQLKPGRRSTYRRGKSVQTTGTTSNPTEVDLFHLCFSDRCVDHDVHLPARTSVWIDADCHHNCSLCVSILCLHIILLFSLRSRDHSPDLHHLVEQMLPRTPRSIWIGARFQYASGIRVANFRTRYRLGQEKISILKATIATAIKSTIGAILAMVVIRLTKAA
jgi:hypothetical protein